MVIEQALRRSESVFFSAGEPSGDLHVSKLMLELGNQLAVDGAEGQFRGFGGPRMAAAGCSLDYQLTDLAVVGFVEVVPKLREFFRVADIASRIFDSSERPDAVLLADFPGFNWHIAKRAKRHDIPVYYYLPPQLWAWGGWRAKKMRRYVDHVICNLPFEAEWFAERGIPAQYVGHPFFDGLDEQALDAEFLDTGRSPDQVSVAVLPGSRSREIKHIWPMQLEAIRVLSQRHRSARFLVACLKPEHMHSCRAILSAEDARLPIEFYVNRTSEIIELADCALMKSGSVSLEMMARGTPAVVVYHVSRTLYAIARRLTDLTTITLPNLLAKRKVMPEFLAVGANCSDAINGSIEAMDRLIGSEQERSLRGAELRELAAEIGQPGASKRAAKFLLEQLRAPSATDPGISSAA